MGRSPKKIDQRKGEDNHISLVDPDLELRGRPGSVLLALPVVLRSVIFFFFYPRKERGPGLP